jgi:hypothetical protein
MQTKQHLRAVNWRYRALLPTRERDLPLPKTPEGTILAS